MKTFYVSDKYKSDPVKFLATVTGLEHLLPRLHNRSDAEYLLTGLVNYRTMSQTKRIEYMSYVHNLPDNRALGIAFYEIAAQQVAQPYWYAWSLTDEELRALLEMSKTTSSWLGRSGLATLSIGSSVTVKAVSDALVDASKKGFKRALSSKVSSSLNVDFGEKLSKGTGAAFAFVTVMASLMFHSAKHDISRSQEELIQRGIIEVSDIK